MGFMKDLQYITHDMGARNDPKLLNLQMEMGGQGLAIFWCLVEMLWENDGRLPFTPKTIAFSLRWATAEEVQRVIEDFGLFERDGETFYSRSALERIGQKKARIMAQVEGGRKGSERRWNRQPIEQPNGSCIGNPMPINIDKYKDIKRDSNNTPLTAADFFETFLFLNVNDPAGEAERFVKHYGDRGWTYTDGTPVDDPWKAAEDWKPAKPGKRFNDSALHWYQAIWNCARDRVPDARKAFLECFVFIRIDGKKILLTYTTREAAKVVYDFINERGYAGEYQLEFRLSNK